MFKFLNSSIRSESGSRIEIGNAFGEERIITITGTPHQIQSAQYLLQQRFKKFFSFIFLFPISFAGKRNFVFSMF